MGRCLFERLDGMVVVVIPGVFVRLRGLSWILDTLWCQRRLP